MFVLSVVCSLTQDKNDREKGERERDNGYGEIKI
jgi:hypothetical protein